MRNMDSKKLKKLGRTDLLELLIEQGRENEQLQARVAELEGRLADRSLRVEKAGTMAEAALLANGFFEAAQEAGKQYLENLERMDREREAILAEARARADATVAETEQACREMTERARAAADRYWQEASARVSARQQEQQE